MNVALTYPFAMQGQVIHWIAQQSALIDMWAASRTSRCTPWEIDNRSSGCVLPNLVESTRPCSGPNTFARAIMFGPNIAPHEFQSVFWHQLVCSQ